jgi:pyruvate,water dikinase
LPGDFFTDNILKGASSVEEVLKRIDNFEFPREFYHDLEWLPSVVSVRSSAGLEDSDTYSFAGVFESFLSVRAEDITEKIKLCWKSLYTDKAVGYLTSQGEDIMKQSMAVVIQTMVESEVSGVMFTEDPFDEELLLIEATAGVGEDLVHGNVTPDVYKVVKEETYIDSVEVPLQNGVCEQYLSGQQILNLAQEGENIQRIYGMEQDIEWAINDDTLYILQSRPITSKVTRNTEENARF